MILFQRLMVGVTVVGIALMLSMSLVRDATPTPEVAGIDSRHLALAPSRDPIRPLPPLTVVEDPRIGLGERLFADPVLSGRGVSCTSCHDINGSGADGRERASSLQGGLDQMNTPTVFNVAYNQQLLWRGNGGTLEEQVGKVLNNPRHMGSNWEGVTTRLASDPGYREAFETYFEDGITPENISIAIAAYERTLVTPDAPFDLYLRGDPDAVDDGVKAGYRLFREYGCIACHQGTNIGGNLMMRFGLFESPYAERKTASSYDLGLFSLTGNKEDRYVFRVPSLRNVALTAPYFHDGSVATLSEAIRFMARIQLGRNIAPEDAALIERFLESLTGVRPGAGAGS